MHPLIKSQFSFRYKFFHLEVSDINLMRTSINISNLLINRQRNNFFSFLHKDIMLGENKTKQTENALSKDLLTRDLCL